MTRTCRLCGKSKCLGDLIKNRLSRFGRARRCKECSAEYSRQYRKQNKDRISSYMRQYYRQNKDIIKKRQAEYRAENPARMRERVRASYYRHRDSRIAKSTAQRRCRRARLAKADGSHTAEERAEVMASNCGLCLYCNEEPAEHADHWLPLSRGGSDYSRNLLPACASCNCSKNDKHPLEWVANRFPCDPENCARILSFVKRNLDSNRNEQFVS